MREDDIRSVIKELPGELLERFSFQLVRRKLYPALNPTSGTYDLGEDGRTEPSTIELHDGKRVSLFSSRTATWTKLNADCLKCKKEGRQIDVIVFATSGDPRTDTVTKWIEQVKKDFGWDLDVRTIKWLASVAADPEFESLALDHLGVPPLDEDFTQHIEAEFARHTGQSLLQAKLHIPGLPEPFQRDEVLYIQDQLELSKAVLLTGDPGTGKSGIAALLTQSAISLAKRVLFLDSRRVEHVRDEAELRRHFSLKGPVCSAIARLGRYFGCRLIIDQLDNSIGLPSARLLVELAWGCLGLNGVEVVVISRHREAQEAQLLQQVSTRGFIELESRPLDELRVIAAYNQLGISNPSLDLIALGQNLLNLEIIGKIKEKESHFDFSNVLEEVDLWESYLEVLKSRDAQGSNAHNAEEIIAAAVELAKKGLNSDDRSFETDYPLPNSHRKLASWGIIVRQYGRIYRFHHEKLQDFLYAWDAAERGSMPSDVMKEINAYRTKNVFNWMDKLYSKHQPALQLRFLEETLNE